MLKVIVYNYDEAKFVTSVYLKLADCSVITQTEIFERVIHKVFGFVIYTILEEYDDKIVVNINNKRYKLTILSTIP